MGELILNRRTFIGLALSTGLIPVKLFSQSNSNINVSDSSYNSNTLLIFNNIIINAKKKNWHLLPLNKIIGTVGLFFLHTPYIGNTLDCDIEKCIVNFQGLDCVTFFENTLCLSRIIKKQKYNFQDLIDEITLTRYKNGIITDYTSRLHYTADWIWDNCKKNIIKDISSELDGIKHNFSVNFMSSHQEYYKALINQPEFIPIIKNTENKINSRDYYYIPKTNIESIENKINTGDIIAIVTNKSGLDYSHIGLAYKDEKGQARFLHASSKKKVVILDTTISEYVNSNSSNLGITVVRPLDMD